VSIEPIIEAGTFGSVGKTATFYPYRPYRFLEWFNTLFVLVLGISMIAPAFAIMVASKFINITPDLATALVTAFMEPGLRIPCIVLAVVMEPICIFSLFVRGNFRFVLNKDGIFCLNNMYSAYSPWENIIGVESKKSSIVSFKALALKKEFQQGQTIEQGRRQGIPVFDYTKLFSATGYPRSATRTKGSFLFWTDAFLLPGIPNGRRLRRKFIAAVHLYAPHIPIEQINK